MILTLDYHYNLSPQDVQQKVLIRQLELAVSLNKNIVSITSVKTFLI